MKKAILLLPLVIIMNCSRPPGDNSAAVPDPAELLKVDKEFSDYSFSHGMNSAFLRFAGDEAVLLRPNGYPIEGIDSIRKMTESRNDSAVNLKWEPLKAFIASNREFGYTYGIYTRTTHEAVTRGTYITIWKKSDDKWKFVFDAGNEGLGE